MQANTAEGAFASPISTSEEISSQKTDHSPAAVSHHSASSLPHTSSTEAPLPFGSPSAPSTCSPGTAHTALPEQIASEDTLSQHNADPEELTAHAVVAEPASPSLCETAAAALLLDLSAAPAPLQTNINVLPAECAADEQAVEATASVLPVQIDNVHDQALPQAAATFGIDEVQALHCAEAEQAHVQTADAASESIQPGAQESSSPASQQPAMVVMPVDEAGRAPRTSTTRPQSAPSTLHQQPLPSVDLDELADRANSSTPLRSQSEEPQQACCISLVCAFARQSVHLMLRTYAHTQK